MKLGAAKAVMALSLSCMGESRREWALAMEGEFAVAVEEGKPFAFACGCLKTALRQMPNHPDGRLALASHAFAFGLLIPIAAFQLACAIGCRNAPTGPGVIYGILEAGGTQGPFLAYAQVRALPALSLLWLVLGAGQLRLAWLLLERDWRRALDVGALIAAVTVTLFLFMEVLFLDVASLAMQAVVMAIEFVTFAAAASWHSRLFPTASAAGAG